MYVCMRMYECVHVYVLLKVICLTLNSGRFIKHNCVSYLNYITLSYKLTTAYVFR